MTDLRHPLLDAAGVMHGFGTRDSEPPSRVARVTQVHGSAVSFLEDGEPRPPEADVIVSTNAALPVGIVTADCVPILAAAADGSAVAAIHAGWRGLAAGVVRAGVEALRARSPKGASLVAAIGPRIGPCCYEIDEPVVSALRHRFGVDLADALHDPAPAQPGKWMLDLCALALVDLERAGIGPAARGPLHGTCTSCDRERFHSVRRDGEHAGRLLHWIQVRSG